MKKSRTPAIASAVLVAALALAGCSSPSDSPGMEHDHGESTSTDAPDDVNAADEMFVGMMIPHHEQAVEMADVLLAKNDVDARVAELARQIKDAQGPEIEQMRSWLETWGVDHDGGEHDHGGDHSGMDGMMSAGEMLALADADGPEATRLFLEQMIVHHEGAIDMAQAVLDDGENPDVRALAEDIIHTQAEEIAAMRDLLNAG